MAFILIGCSCVPGIRPGLFNKEWRYSRNETTPIKLRINGILDSVQQYKYIYFADIRYTSLLNSHTVLIETNSQFIASKGRIWFYSSTAALALFLIILRKNKSSTVHETISYLTQQPSQAEQEESKLLKLLHVYCLYTKLDQVKWNYLRASLFDQLLRTSRKDLTWNDVKNCSERQKNL